MGKTGGKAKAREMATSRMLRCLLVAAALGLIGPLCGSPFAGAVGTVAQLEIDEVVFFDEFKKMHGRGWAKGEEGGLGLAAVLEHILGAPLAEVGKLACNEAFETVAAKWRGGPIPPPIFAQMLRSARLRSAHWNAHSNAHWNAAPFLLFAACTSRAPAC